ncbi:glycoside hydrolase family 127 protein [Weissella fangxianensis]|uniref:glycoside hydrolase family 127 protein n=1 Tax=Weissella fangxianensis TaxID=2953879 RepID=UPI00215774BB|nr:beta-L-arabinofuranosidase domain-containing protein [Weissella fangxianensis]
METAEKIELKEVYITSDFWNNYRELVVKEVLPYQWQVMNDTANVAISADPQNNGRDKNSHAVANLKIAAGEMTGHHYGFPFQDTDVYKWLEAAAYSFSYHPNPDLQKITDNLIELIASAQDDDGYLSTYFQIDAPERKFKRLQQSHELYTMGHYIEAGVAYYQSTGNELSLEIATRMADCIDSNFGNDENKISGYDGHPEIELALSRLYEQTGQKKYLALAKYFLKERGKDPEFFDEQDRVDGWDNDILPGMRDLPRSYYQAAEPISEQKTADGHAVRVVYLCTGMAYVARFTGDEELLAACHRFWKDIVRRRMYITGNIGSTTIGEAFTYDYDLPNDTMYGETCASVGMAFFARQMLKIEPKGEYGDVLEKELFNGALSGMSLDGKHFFYVNPLEADPIASRGNPGKSHVLTHRADWFGCACCPANLARLITSLDQYLYTIEGNVILSHQFVSNEATFGDEVKIAQTNNFPWDGNIHYEIKDERHIPFTLGIRIPSWSTNFDFRENGRKVRHPVVDGFIYIEISDSTTIDLDLDMEVKVMKASNRVASDFGKLAIQRGPIVYAAEEVDNSAPLWLYKVTPNAETTYKFNDSLFNGNGVGIIQIAATKETLEKDGTPLYREATTQEENSVDMRLIPYYAWANRENGQMRVWLNEK